MVKGINMSMTRNQTTVHPTPVFARMTETIYKMEECNGHR